MIAARYAKKTEKFGNVRVYKGKKNSKYYYKGFKLRR